MRTTYLALQGEVVDCPPVLPIVTLKSLMGFSQNQLRFWKASHLCGNVRMKENRMEQIKMPSSVLTWKLKSLFSDWQLYVLVLPAFIYVFIFSYIPMYGAQIAFNDFRADLGIWGSKWVGFKNLIRFISFPNFWLIIRNTLSISLYSLATFPCSVIFALCLNEITNIKFKKTIQMVSYAPHFLSTVVVCSLIRLFLAKDTGVINHFLAFLGKERIEFIIVASFFNDIYVWSGVWQNIGWGAILYLYASAIGLFNTIVNVSLLMVVNTIAKKLSAVSIW
jgi:putative aldouronate transport system permease protein